jgi:cytochrome d ubiquinol oxidase subunit I
MVAAGSLMILLSYGVYLTIKERIHLRRRFLRVMIPAISLPFIANTMGWIMTEIGRQPWVVYGLFKMEDSVSLTVSAGHVLATLIGFGIVYAILAIIDIFLFIKTIREEPDDTFVPSL